MRRIAKGIYGLLFKLVFKKLRFLAYGHYSDDWDDIPLLKYAFLQRIIGFNRSVPWPVHFTSTVTAWKNIKFGKKVNPGDSPGCYIQGGNGIEIGSNVWIGPNVVIVSSNHNIDDYDLHTKTPPIKIGSNVWIGANSAILAGTIIGDNVIIGAGSIVTGNIPGNCIAAGNPCKVIKGKPPYKGKQYI